MGLPADMSRLIATAMTLLGLVPLIWLAMRAPRSRVWWWMAAGFAVSFVADVASLLGSHQFVSQLYPVTQSAIFAILLLPRRWTEGVIGLFLLAESVSVVTRRGEGLDILLHVVAWGTVAVLAWRLIIQQTLRLALLVYFGLGTLYWLAYVTHPGWATWGGYQMTRLLGVALWCAAAWQAARRAP